MKRECFHKTVHHEHGTPGGYRSDGCRCDECTDNAAIMSRARRRQIAYGRIKPNPPAEASRNHLIKLSDEAGIGYRRLAVMTGIPARTLWDIRNGRRKTVTWRVQEAVLAAGTDGSFLRDPTGTRRRVRALMAIGWSESKIAELTGLTRFTMTALLKERSELIAETTVKAVARVYDELWDKEPPTETKYDRAAITRSRGVAARNGWLPPLAWDNIDDPDEDPGDVVRHEKRCRPAEAILEDLEWLYRTGMDAREALARVRIDPGRAALMARKAGMVPLARWIEMAKRARSA